MEPDKKQYEPRRPQYLPTTCPLCGKDLVPGAGFCPNCGEAIHGDQYHVSPPPVITLEAVVGKKQEYYIPEFDKIEAGQKNRFNWAAFILGPIHCFYRKCGNLFKKYFLVSMIFILVGYLSTVAMTRTWNFSAIPVCTAISAAGAILQFINLIRYGKNFNRHYYQQCKDQRTVASPKSGISIKNAVLFSVVVLAVFFASVLLVSTVSGIWLQKSLNMDDDILSAVDDNGLDLKDEELSVPEPEDEELSVPEPEDEETEIDFLGDYTMIGSGEDFGAYLYIHQNDQGTVLLEGSAHYNSHIGEVSGIVQMVDSCHFYVEDYGSRLDVAFDPDTQQLSVEESGDPLGGIGVTFSGDYTKETDVVSDTAEAYVPNVAEPQSETPPDDVVAQLLSEWMPSFVGLPSDTIFHWIEPRAVTAEVYIESVIPEAFTISGYVNILMTQSADGSWYAEGYDDYTSITYNYSDEYRDHAETCGVWIERDVTIANGYAAITVMPMDFTGIGTDPTRDPVLCYLESYHDSTESSVEYRLWDGTGHIQVLLDTQMRPVFFQLNLS